MNCKQTRDRLPDYSVGAAGARAAAEVELHLSECAECRRELDALNQVALLVEQHGAVDPPAGMFDAVRYSITSGQVRQDHPWWLVFFGRPARALAAGMAMASVALGLLAPVGGPRPLPQNALHPAPLYGGIGQAQASSELANSIRQHAMSAGDGSLNDRVAWEAMAQIVSQPGARGGRRGLEPGLPARSELE